MAGNQGHAASGSFTIQGTSGPVTEFPWWIILVIAIPLGLAVVVIGLKKSKKKSVQVVIIDKELDKMKEKRKVLEEEAKTYIKAHNYVKAAEIYEECAKISSHLYNEGDKVEQYKYKEYKRLELDANSQAEAIPLKNDCINNIITKYFDENGIKYYSNPQIYPEEDGIVSGLILNDNGLLQNRFTKLNDGSYLANQLQVDTSKLESINAIQFLFTDNLSVDSLVEYCQKFQNPEMMLLIIGIEWPSYHYDDIIPVPKDKDIKFHENIKIVNLDLFSKIMLIDEQSKVKLNEIVDLKNDLNALENLYNATKIQLHDTTELKDELKQKGWFFLI